MAKATAKAEAASESTAIERTGSALAMMGHDDLADVLGDVDLGTDGLEEIDGSDVRLAALIWNFKGTDNAGDPVPANRFFNTVTEEVSSDEALALLTLHKSNAWKEFDEADGRNVMRCASWDRVTGEMDTGKVRPCEGCPDKQWRRDPETGKRSRNCADVANVVALKLKTGQPVVLRFTKTSEKPWKDFLNREILGKRVINGKRVNEPLFARPTTLRLEMAKGAKGSYAVPVLERAAQPFTLDEMRFFAESAKGFREGHLDSVRDVLDRAPDDEPTTGANGGSADTSFDPSDFADGGGDFDDPQVIDTTGTASTGTGDATRF